MTAGAAGDVRVFEDSRSLSRAAAELFLFFSQESIAVRGRFSVALSGGSTPKLLYTLLGSLYRDALPWPRVHLFWADERCVSREHAESNYKLVYDTLLSKIRLPDENIHRIRGEEGPEEAARKYEEDVRRFFSGTMPVFDLILLGAGEDGHTASLFPGSPKLKETRRLALPVYLEKPGIDRVTLSLPVLNHALKVLFLAEGRAKAGVVHEIIEDGNPKNYPAGLVHPVHGDVTWMLDSGSASALTTVVMRKL